MVVKDIIQLMKAVQQTDFESFELTDKDFTLKLDRKGAKVSQSSGPKLLSEMPAAASLNLLSEATDTAAPAIAVGKEVLSPLIGIYHSLPEGKTIKIGDKLKKGDSICLIEAMKLMNEIQMPEDGEITKVFAKDGQLIEYEQPLFSYV